VRISQPIGTLDQSDEIIGEEEITNNNATIGTLMGINNAMADIEEIGKEVMEIITTTDSICSSRDTGIIIIGKERTVTDLGINLFFPNT
jgi:hypothetical protein